jgi:uncharacterized protein (TIGR00369 family)
VTVLHAVDTADLIEDGAEPPSGLDVLRAIQAGDLPRPGVAVLLGMQMDEVELGRVSFSMVPRPDMANPMGSMHGGIVATLLDTVMGCAVHSSLDGGGGYTTLDLDVRYVRSAPLTGDVIRAYGNVVHVGGRTATAEGRVIDADGHLLAHATTTCMLFRPGVD